MRVAVTGGTGYVGAHTVAALQRAGHTVRLLVRSPPKVADALEAVGGFPDTAEVVLADVLDAGAVAAGLQGADALVHAASVFSLDRRRCAEIEATNERGIRVVFEAALAAGLDPVVHVSSTVALMQDGTWDQVLTEDSPPGDSPHAYSGSKARQERYVRELQAGGAPVVITYPGGVFGPHDPYNGESVQVLRGFARRAMTLLHHSGYAVSDVRDVAAVHAALMEPGRGRRRYLAAGHYTSTREMKALVAEVLGRRLPDLRIPATMASSAGWLIDRVLPRGAMPGVSQEAAWISGRRARVDASATQRDLGITFRPVRDSVTDQLVWMRAADRL